MAAVIGTFIKYTKEIILLLLHIVWIFFDRFSGKSIVPCRSGLNYNLGVVLVTIGIVVFSKGKWADFVFHHFLMRWQFNFACFLLFCYGRHFILLQIFLVGICRNPLNCIGRSVGKNFINLISLLLYLIHNLLCFTRFISKLLFTQRITHPFLNIDCSKCFPSYSLYILGGHKRLIGNNNFVFLG